MASGAVFTIQGRSLKLDTAEDIAPHIEVLKASPDVLEIRLGGNTLGGSRRCLTHWLPLHSLAGI